jgi:hypothetical protein
MKMINALLEYRDSEEFKFENITDSKGNPLTLGDVTTLNLTMLKVRLMFWILCTHHLFKMHISRLEFSTMLFLKRLKLVGLRRI